MLEKKISSRETDGQVENRRVQSFMERNICDRKLVALAAAAAAAQQQHNIPGTSRILWSGLCTKIIIVRVHYRGEQQEFLSYHNEADTVDVPMTLVLRLSNTAKRREVLSTPALD